MSKLNELIQELSTNGIEYKFLNEIAHYARGRINVSEINQETYVGVENLLPNKAGKTTARYVPTEGSVIAFRAGDILIGNIRPYLRKIWLADCDGGTNGDVLVVQLNGIVRILPKFLYYVMSSEDFFSYDVQNSKGAKMPRGDKDAVLKYKVPVPPLEVQHEIVRILDNFTELTEELTEELTARKKQYEYYRDNLLKFDISIPKVKLKDIATDIYRGSGITREQVTEDGIPCVRYGEIYTTYNIWFDECKSHTKIENVANPKYFEYGDILFAITGENVEDIAKSTAYVGNDKCLAGGDIVVMKHKQNPKYLSYALSTHNAQQQKSKGKIKSKVVHSSVPAIEEIEIPLPDLDVQNRLVNVLDNFDSICTDLNIGLPAEIEARQRQYEYYRDLLLTFVERGNTILTDRQTDRQTDRNCIDFIYLCN